MKWKSLVAWILVSLGSVVGLMLLATVGGLFLPGEHVAARALQTRQSPQVIWQTITDHANEAVWRGDLKKVERLPDRGGREVWREIYRQGSPITLETTEAMAPHRLVRTIVNEGGPFSGHWEFEIAPSARGSQLTITERGTVPNPFFRFVSRFVIGQATFIEAYLKALATKFGEPAEITNPAPSAISRQLSAVKQGGG